MIHAGLPPGPWRGWGLPNECTPITQEASRKRRPHPSAFSTADVHAPHVMPCTDSCGRTKGQAGGMQRMSAEDSAALVQVPSSKEVGIALKAGGLGPSQAPQRCCWVT